MLFTCRMLFHSIEVYSPSLSHSRSISLTSHFARVFQRRQIYLDKEGQPREITSIFFSLCSPIRRIHEDLEKVRNFSKNIFVRVYIYIHVSCTLHSVCMCVCIYVSNNRVWYKRQSITISSTQNKRLKDPWTFQYLENKSRKLEKNCS